MENLSMCRVCLGEDIRLHSIVKTHLQEMYESLVLMPLETKDGRPLLACYICYARLENCYELRKSCLRSEELLIQMLSNNESEQVKLQRINNKRLTMHNAVHLSIGHILEMKADVKALKCEVKLEANDAEDIDENALEENSVFDNVQSADSDDDFLITLKEEQTGDRTSYPTPKESTQDDLRNPEDLTSSNFKDQKLEQDTLLAVHKLNAADVTAVQSTNKAKKKPTSERRSERVQYTCDTCQQSYTSKCELEKHVRVCSDVWKKDFSRGSSTSIYTHTARKPRQCTVCNKSFIRIDHLTSHILTHTGEKPYECTVCKKKFSRKSHVIRHMRTHSSEKPYKCNVCKKEFSDKCGLVNHMRTLSGEEPYQCNICKNHFLSKSCLRVHMRTHTDEKAYECTVCKKKFSRKSHVIRHMPTHSSGKPYECTVCKIQFSEKRRFINHMRKQSGDKPYQCNICKNQFIWKGCLRVHMSSHTGEKPYECTVCKKLFTNMYDLTRHMSIHNDEKPFECTVCNKKFSLKSHLIRHTRAHSTKKLYQCDICKKHFSSKDYLRIHVYTHR